MWLLLLVLAQTPDDLVARGDAWHEAIQPAEALAAYREALALDSVHYGALWRAARSQSDVARTLQGRAADTVAMRDSMFTLAVAFARRAIAADSTDADGWFTLALALGQQSRTKGGQERIRFGRDIYDAAARALALNPNHDGAHHILGAWHAEVRRLSGFTRFLARTLLGGGYMGRANWDSAVVHLEQAVAGRPDYLFHYLELAEIYVDVDRPADAIAPLEIIPTLPNRDVLDPEHRARAAALLDRLRRP